MRTSPYLRIALCLTFTLTIYSAFAQLNKTWLVNLPQNDFDYIKGDKIQFETPTNFYAFTRYISGVQQYQTTRFDADGNILWSRNETSGTANYGPSEMVLHEGVYVTGSTINPTYSYTTRYQTNGDTVFSEFTSNVSGLQRIAKDPLGNIVITGMMNPGGGLPDYIQLTKYTSSGTMMWQFDYAPGNLNTHYDNYLAITSDDAGNFYVAFGHVDNNADPSVRSLRIMKVDEGGTKVWDVAVDEANDGNYLPTDIKFNPIDNSVYVAYEFNALIIPSLDKFSRVTAAGSTTFTKSYSGNQGGGDNRVRIGDDGSIYWWHSGGSIGSFYGFAHASGYYYSGTIVKYDSQGNELAFFSGSAFSVDAAGNVYTVYAADYFGPRIHIRKYTPNGVLLTDEMDLDNYSFVYLDTYCDNNNHAYVMAGLIGTNTAIIKYDLSCSYSKAPAKPAVINGPLFNVCGSNSYSFNCPSVNKATHYYWSIPEGANIGGQGTNSVSISFPEGFSSGKVNVYASNCYGASKLQSITVYGVPAKPGAIAGPSSVCAFQTNVLYSINPVTGANAYNWKVPEGASIITGQGSTQVAVNYGNMSGKIKVKSKSDCGNSEYKVLKVAMNCRMMDGHTSWEVFNDPSAQQLNIRFNLNSSSVVAIKLYDVSGKTVRSLLNENMQPGLHTVKFNTDDLSKGMYVVNMLSENASQKEKVIIQ